MPGPSSFFAIGMPLAPVTVSVQALFVIEPGHPISRFVDLSGFQLRRNAVPISVDVVGKGRTGAPEAR
jgi:hypothetical protein